MLAISGLVCWLGAKRAVMLAVGLQAALCLFEYGRWLQMRQHSFEESSARLRRDVPEGGVLLGQNLAATLAIEHRARVYSAAGIWDAPSIEPLIRELGVTHILCGDRDEGMMWVTARSRRIGEYRVGRIQATLLEWKGEEPPK